jgi:hypothetical protein
LSTACSRARSPASPVWSTIIITIDVLILYGLLVYGGRRDLAA